MQYCFFSKFLNIFIHLLVLFCFGFFLAEKSGKEVMSKGSTGMEVILASLKVSFYSNNRIIRVANLGFLIYYIWQMARVVSFVFLQH